MSMNGVITFAVIKDLSLFCHINTDCRALNYESACQKVGVPYKNECHKNAILIH